MHDVGPPTRTVVVDPVDKSQACNGVKERTAVKQLEYDDPEPEGVADKMRKLRGKPKYGLGVVCVDRSGSLVGTFWIQF
jgi:hypothetical protein